MCHARCANSKGHLHVNDLLLLGHKACDIPTKQAYVITLLLAAFLSQFQHCFRKSPAPFGLRPGPWNGTQKA